MTRIGLFALAMGRAARPWRRAMILCVASAVAVTAVAHAQSTSRPQLVVQRAEADLTAETLLIEGQKLLWNNDSDITVWLAGTPLGILSATETHVLAQLPPGLAPGGYLVRVSRGSGAVQNQAARPASRTRGRAGGHRSSQLVRIYVRLRAILPERCDGGTRPQLPRAHSPAQMPA